MAWELEWSDDFERPDGNLGSNWSQPLANAFEIASGEAQYSGVWGGGAYDAVYNTELSSADQAVEADLTNGATDADHELFVRSDLDGDPKIVVRLVSNSLLVNGSFVIGSGLSYPADCLFRVEVIDDDLNVLVNGSSIWTQTVTNMGGPTHNYGGMRGSVGNAFKAVRGYVWSEGGPTPFTGQYSGVPVNL